MCESLYDYFTVPVHIVVACDLFSEYLVVRGLERPQATQTRIRQLLESLYQSTAVQAPLVTQLAREK